MKESGFPRCHQVTVPPHYTESYTTQSYTRTLLQSGNGTPLWDPMGDVGSIDRRSSISIGDVGWFNTDGDFTYYFNIFLPRTHPGQFVCPPNFEPLLPPPQTAELEVNEKHFLPGATLVSPGVEVSYSSSEPL